jgi:hypothetical protein
MKRCQQHDCKNKLFWSTIMDILKSLNNFEFSIVREIAVFKKNIESRYAYT